VDIANAATTTIVKPNRLVDKGGVEYRAANSLLPYDGDDVLVAGLDSMSKRRMSDHINVQLRSPKILQDVNGTYSVQSEALFVGKFVFPVGWMAAEKRIFRTKVQSAINNALITALIDNREATMG